MGLFDWINSVDQSLDSWRSSIGSNWNKISGTTEQNEFNSEEAEKARAFNSAEAQKERDWQTEMSNTAYQRQVADMEAAGLNPAAINGNGASTPSGYAASAAAAHSNSNGGPGAMFAGIVKAAIGSALYDKVSNSSFSYSSAISNMKTAEALDNALKSSPKTSAKKSSESSEMSDEEYKKAYSSLASTLDELDKSASR